MDLILDSERIIEIEKELTSLIPGYLVRKTIKGTTYYYLRTKKDGKVKETYIPFEHVSQLRSEIEKRKKLESELRLIQSLAPRTEKKERNTQKHLFKTYVRTGEELYNFAKGVKGYKKRYCYQELHDYIFTSESEKVLILYGLRRTGKTTLIRQGLMEMADDMRQKSAFFQIRKGNTLSDVNHDLHYLESQGFQYIFIDEVTQLEDFIEGSSLFSDIYASSGMKIVLSGADSLGFLFSKSGQLYDRCILIHTTFIPYKEFEEVLGISGIDNYIQYGGTMSLSGTHYNETSLFSTNESVSEYIDSAIAHNIQHSLKYYQDGGHFHSLYDLYEKRELTSVINRTVEDINHRFTKEILTRTFQSADISLTARNLLNDRLHPLDLYENIEIEIETVTQSIKNLLEILDKEQQSVEIEDIHAVEIKEYLKLLDLIQEIDLYHLPNITLKEKKTVITQPGLRYAQAKAIVDSLMLDDKFQDLSPQERKLITERLMTQVKGRMMEDIILLETRNSRKDKKVFQLQFPIGEFDMVVYDEQNLTCEIYEVKHSTEYASGQYRHLTDEEKIRLTEHRYGKITGRYVIYRGEEMTTGNGIQYLNAENYLKSL